MYGMAMHFAKSSAASSLIDGWKTVEMCQAYQLLSAYSVPPRRWEEDRSWAYTGLAMRYADQLFLVSLMLKSIPKVGNRAQSRCRHSKRSE